MTMKYRETYSDDFEVKKINHDSMEIMADDGRVLYTIDLKPNGDLEVHTASTVKHGGVMLDSQLSVTAKGSNWLKLSRTEYS